MSEWQPIETAPKDGTRFLGFWPELDGGTESATAVKTWWKRSRWENPWESSDIVDAPTHWMPLPNPPEGVKP